MAEAKTNRAPATTGREENTLQRRQPTGNFASPFDLFDQMAQEMDRTFDRMFRGWGMPRRSRQGLWSPRIEAVQKGDRFIIRAELPGLKKDDVHVEMTDDAITIQGERHEEHEDEREGYFQSEREYGEFYRTIPLPDGVIGESAQASFRDGVLEISMQAPPAEANRGRRLEIKEPTETGEKK